ncbi:MAG: aminopeptidase N [Chloroflexi bacterium]|nr:aminopeptidase N [Chloroflexota bacterium]
MAAPNLTRADAQARAELLDVDTYEVGLDLTDSHGRPSEQTFRSTTTVRFRARRAGAATFVDLMADRIHRAALNGRPLDTSGYAEETGLRLEDLAEVNTLIVDAECRYSHTGEGLHRFVDPVDNAVYLYTQFETADAKRVYACFDQPDLKATFSLAVTAPADWQVISNGRPVEWTEAPDGSKLVRFATTPRVPTYITALAAGPYHRARTQHAGIDLGVYCRASLAPFLDADELFEVTRQGFDWFQREFAYPYAFDKYDQVFVPEFNAGAMENAACITFREELVFRSRVTDYAYERRAETILHEMAHMWFGDLVTMRWWDDLWLNESFASFVSVLCQAEATRWGSAWTTFARVEKAWAYRQDQLPSTHPIAADIPDLHAVEVNFDGITYAKGASVLRQLVAYVGRDAFMRAMRSYFRAHAFGNATLADLLRALEEESGRDLAAWAVQWLESAGVNTLRADFALDAEDRYVSFDVLQSPAEPLGGVLRSHRLAIGVYQLRGDAIVRVQRIELDLEGERTPVPELIGVARPDLLLINDDDLTYAKVRLDEHSLATTVAGVTQIVDPLARALCWAAAWDMTRDGEMAARDYVSLALTGVVGETEIGAVQTIQGRLTIAIDRYADPAWAAEGWSALASTALDELRAAAPASDLQLAWMRSFASAARSAGDAALLRGVLDGSEVVPGLAVDADLRWSLLQALVAIGAAGDREIDTELARDATASGQRRAATARALRPTEEAKAEAWRAMTADLSLPNAILEAAIAGFYHPAQHALTERYVERYFADIGDVWAAHSSEMARSLASGLYPDAVSPAALAAADGFLARSDLPPGLRRLVGEGRDDLRRALHARAFGRTVADAVVPTGES